MYVSKPPSAAEKPTKGILYLTDVCGIQLLENRLCVFTLLPPSIPSV